MCKKGLLGKDKLGKLGVYENCIFGKGHGVKYSKGKHITKGILDFVKSDLWRPGRSHSQGGAWDIKAGKGSEALVVDGTVEFKVEPRRLVKTPERYEQVESMSLGLITIEETERSELLIFDEAVKSIASDKWKKARQMEFQSLMEIQTWSLMEKPKG